MAKKQAKAPINGGAVIIDDGGPGKIEIAGRAIEGVPTPRIKTEIKDAAGIDTDAKHAFVEITPEYVVVYNNGATWQASASDVRCFQVFASFETIKGAIYDKGLHLEVSTRYKKKKVDMAYEYRCEKPGSIFRVDIDLKSTGLLRFSGTSTITVQGKIQQKS